MPITDDNVIEAQENFTVVLSNVQSNLGVGLTGPDTATGTINDDDAAGNGVSFASTNVTVTEGTDAFARFTVNFNGTIAPGQDVTVDYVTNDGTALDGDDFTAQSGTITFNSTTPSFNIDVPITDDNVIEAQKNFTVVLSNVQSNLGVGLTGADTATGTINDDDAAGNGVSFASTNVTVTEGTDAFARFTVNFNGTIAPGQDVTVDYVTNDGTALDGDDFTAQSGTITFNSTTSTSFNIDVPITDDNVIEAQENFTVVLSNVQSNLGVGLTGPDTATGTINDDDAAGNGVSFASTNVTVTEGTDAFARFTVNFNGTIAPGQDVTVDYVTNDGTALDGDDFTAQSGTITFNSTTPSFNIDVPITDDNVIEAQENFTVVLSNVQSNLGVGLIGPDTATGTINDDDAAGNGVSFASTNVTVTEGTDAFARFTVNFNGTIAPGQDVTVDYVTNDGTALDGDDFTAQSGTITFNSTTPSFNIDVPITDDNVIEAQENFTVVLSNVQSNLGVGLTGPDTATGTINDDDAAGNGVSFASTNVTVTEGTDAFARFTVNFNGTIAPGQDVTVDYVTNDGTALDGDDFTAQSGTITFNSTTPSFNIDVPITDDNVIEAQENFTVVLSNVQSNLGVGLTGPDTATGTINDDDAAGNGVSFASTNVTVTEGTDAFARFTVNFNGTIAPGQDVTVDYVTNDGTALDGDDFTAQSGTITFNSTTSTSFNIDVPITDDNVIEAQENFTVVLSNVQSNLGVGLTGPDTATGTINDDDAAGNGGVLRLYQRHRDGRYGRLRTLHRQLQRYHRTGTGRHRGLCHQRWNCP